VGGDEWVGGSALLLCSNSSGGALVEGWGNTASPHLGEGPRASGEAWETVVGRGGEGVRALFF
jgi:hypothetical protein